MMCYILVMAIQIWATQRNYKGLELKKFDSRGQITFLRISAFPFLPLSLTCYFPTLHS